MKSLAKYVPGVLLFLLCFSAAFMAAPAQAENGVYVLNATLVSAELGDEENPGTITLIIYDGSEAHLSVTEYSSFYAFGELTFAELVENFMGNRVAVEFIVYEYGYGYEYVLVHCQVIVLM